VESADVTNISGLGLAIALALCIFLLILPRRYAIAPIIICACFMTLGQTVVIFGLHFSVLRILILAGVLRIIFKREYASITGLKIDKLIVGWLIISLVVNTMLWQTMDALTFRLGFTYNALGLYFIFRSIIRDMDDILRAVKILILAIIPLTVIMTNEYVTGKNLFSVFSGVPEYTGIRDGRFRCQGPFRHPILAGTFGATATVLVMSLWFEKSISRALIIWGFISTLIITFISVSSGALLALGSALLSSLLWPIRKNMRIVRRGLLCGVIILHLLMKAPVWYLFAKLSNVFGGGGWHRSFLIDQAISHFSEWWLFGTKYTANWMPYVLANNPDSADITNQYLLEGINGGAVTMILFISIIVAAFRIIGNSREKMSTMSNNHEKIVWLLGASLIAHVVSFISVPYFDQMIVFWYMLLASIATLGVMVKNESAYSEAPTVV
jgi:hypothetical protein